MRYFKIYWEEDVTGWGSQTYYFEVGDNWYPTRQIELFENGKILWYDETKLHDDDGALAEKPLSEAPQEILEEISQAEFEEQWRTARLL